MIKDDWLLSKKQSVDENEAINNLSNDLEQLFNEILDTILNLIKANDDEILLLYEVEEIFKLYIDTYEEILSDNIQDYYIQQSYNVEATINNKVANKSIDNSILINLVDKDDYQHLLDEWLNNDYKAELTKQIQKKVRYGNNLNNTLDKYLVYPHSTAFTVQELLEWEIDEAIVNYLTNNVFTASASTMSRVTQEVYDIIREQYANQGEGINVVRDAIQDQFQDLAKYEAQRIARTETLKARGSATYNRLINNDAVEYIQWIATDDDRTRESHVELNGEITYADGTGLFSNGLRYAGDTEGDIEEWINCRCDIIAYVPDIGFVPPPNATSWYEEDMLFDTSVWDIDIPEIEYTIEWE